MNLTIKDLAADIALAGVPLETARNRISNYAQNGLIFGRREGANTSPNYYQPESAAMAVMFSALQDCGVADLEVLHAVHVCSFQISECLAGLARGESWSLVIEISRDTVGKSGRFICPRASCAMMNRLRTECLSV